MDAVGMASRWALALLVAAAALPMGCAGGRGAGVAGLRVAAASDASPREASRGATALEKQMTARVNQERRRAGLPPLTWNDSLAAAAREHSRILRREMTLWGEELGFGHHGRVAARLDRLGYAWRACGENVAYGERRTIEHLHQGLMRSPHHRENILSRRFTEVGVGVLVDGPRLYATQVFATSAQDGSQ